MPRHARQGREEPPDESTGKDYGKPYQYDPDFHGPQSKRSCTDVLCLMIFMVFVVAWGVLGYYAYRNGDPERILHPTDSSGRQCGVHDSVKDKPYLFYFDLSRCAKTSVLTDGCSSSSVCLTTCPDRDFYAEKHFGDSRLGPNLAICLYNVTQPNSGKDLERLVNQKQCTSWYKKSIPVGKFCIPDIGGLKDHVWVENEAWLVDTTTEELKKGSVLTKTLMNAYEFGEKFVSDMVVSYKYVLGGYGIAMGLSIVYIFLMRWLAGPIVWTSIIGVLALLGFGIYECYIYYKEINEGRSGPASSIPEVEDILQSSNTWMVLMCVLGIFLGILLLLTIFLRKRIQLAVALLQEAGKAVSGNLSTLVFPIIPWAVQLAVLAYALIVILYLCTSGKAVYKVQGLNETVCVCNPGPYKYSGEVCDVDTFTTACGNCMSSGVSCQFFRYQPPDYTKWLQLFNAFCLFWVLFFVSGMAQMILACVFATWYWTYKKSDVPFFVVTYSFFVCVSYHSGTVAFGALIITIVRVIRLVLQYIQKKAKKYALDNAFARGILCCCQCCFACLENFLKFVSKNAYIMCAVHGKNFCASARDAFNLLMRNIIRVFVIDKITDFVLFMGELLITSLVCTAMHFALQKWPLELNYTLVPIGVAGIGAFLIAAVFFSVYSMAVDTLFLCFLEDCERNDTSEGRPYFMSKSLMKLFGKKHS